MDDILIRKCTLRDIDVIHQLEKQWAEEDITYGQEPNPVEKLMDKLGEYFLVADVDNGVVGFICGSMHVSEGLAVIPEGQGYLEIDDIYVRPEYRSQGVGGLLLESLLEIAKQQSIKRFSVYTATKNIDKIYNFYRSHGFQSWFIRLFQ